MKIFGAFKEGLGSVGQSKRYILLVYLVSLLVTLSIAVALSGTIERSLGDSLAGENMLSSFDSSWYSNFSSQASGLAATFTPSVVGIGAVFNGLDAFLRGNLASTYAGIAGVGILYLLMWTFFSGGFISIYAAQDERPSFFQRAARFFPRFLFLGVLAAGLYFVVIGFVGSGLRDLIAEQTRETIDERVHLAYTVSGYLIMWLLIWSINLVFDYSKILTVVEEHKSVISAPWRAVSLIFSNFGRTYGLYFMIGGSGVAVMLLYWLMVPGAGQSSGIAIFGTFLLGQIYIITRIATRCFFFAGQTAMATALTSVEMEATSEPSEEVTEDRTE